ncbi:MAG: acyl-CoA thioesterase [Candidatus Poseidoniia archaeon]|jgi:acyl-CoA thioesterase YciA|nr:acyl-CoA thioesterase [Candidatus Poseidoniia archaeon]|tara:strand:- start:494 stop:883 length:390 start_codon:yes stop_codon:yes gene_type:complete
MSDGEGQPVIRVLMMPKDTNAFGTIFGGVILSQIDQAAAIEAHRHHVGIVVTIAMDSVEFKQPVLVGDLVSYYCTTHRVGTSSVSVDVNVMAQRQFAESGKFIPVTEARVTMVAIGDDCQPIPLSRPQD